MNNVYPTLSKYNEAIRTLLLKMENIQKEFQDIENAFLDINENITEINKYVTNLQNLNITNTISQHSTTLSDLQKTIGSGTITDYDDIITAINEIIKKLKTSSSSP